VQFTTAFKFNKRQAVNGVIKRD